MSNLPILLKIFNRPENSVRVIEALRIYKPACLYIDGDGPRNPEEAPLVAATRTAVLAAVDWQCEIKTNFSPTNVGLRKGMPQAISWFFEQEPYGIILEDDCVPSQSFFPYCEELLERYADTDSIMHISGCNFQPKTRTYPGSYYFSKFSYVWGWASWKRAWVHYQANAQTYTEFKSIGGLSTISSDSMVQSYWDKLLTKATNDQLTTWDYQWTYSIWANNGLSINPSKNLISNIGFGSAAATNTKGDSILANRATEPLTITKHPTVLLPYAEADEYSFNFHRQPNMFKRIARELKYRLLKR
jgi:hypothetical protein